MKQTFALSIEVGQRGRVVFGGRELESIDLLGGSVEDDQHKRHVVLHCNKLDARVTALSVKLAFESLCRQWSKQRSQMSTGLIPAY